MSVSLIRLLLTCGFICLIISEHKGQNRQPKSDVGDAIQFKILKTTGDTLDFDQAYRSIDKFSFPEDAFNNTRPEDTYWILLDFKRGATSKLNDSIQYLKLNYFDFGEIFYQKGDSIVTRPIGQLDENTIAKRISSSKYHCEIPLDFKSLIQNQYLFLRVKRIKFIEPVTNWSFTYQQNSESNSYTWSDIAKSIPNYIYMGIGFTIGIIMLVYFFHFRKIEFLLYSSFVFFKIIYLFQEEVILLDKLHVNNTLLKSWLLETNSILIGIAYNLFILFYLNVKKEYPRVYYFLKVGVYIHVLMLVVDLVFLLFTYHLGHIYLILVLRVVSFLITVSFLVYLFFYNKNRISKIFLIGSSCFFISIIVYYYFNLKAGNDPMLYGNSLFLAIGSTLEMLFFAYGLTYKAFDEHLQGIYFKQEAIINKNKALRAQINPHFIFNALSSIQHLILKKKNTSALNYLSKFSRITRNALEASIDGQATLDEEIKMLNDYLELESLRFDHAFSFRVEVEEQLVPSEMDIPFMITQPFVENAILHGLLPKTSGKKELTVAFEEKDDDLICTIDDTGIGRNNHQNATGPNQEKRKSRGLEVTLSRLASWPYGSGKVEIIDKVDKNNVPLGTKVVIVVPLGSKK